MESETPPFAFGPYEVRAYVPGDDTDMIARWSDAHGTEFKASWLSPFGSIAVRGGEPVAACFLYLPVGVGVAFAEFAYSAPGQTAAQVTEAMDIVCNGLRTMAKANDYGIIVTTAPRSIARRAKRIGWRPMGKNLETLWTAT